MSSIKQYLTQYAQKEITFVQKIPRSFIQDIFDYSLVVPVYNEYENFDKLMNSIMGAADNSTYRILVIAVINSRVSTSKNIIENNIRLINSWSSRLHNFWEKGGEFRFLGGFWKNIGVLFIDRNSRGYRFQEKRGVGLARKIGADVATAFYYRGYLHKKIIFNTDCDAVLPQDFFTKDIDDSKKKLAIITPFIYETTHHLDYFHREATLYYKKYLDYYICGLKRAKSPYAYFSIGSTIAFSVESYATVRGFPKNRLAGEDFYLLNKIAKIGQVYLRKSDPIVLQARFSERVPFGTGQSIRMINEYFVNEEPYLVYHPECFDILYLWIYAAEYYLNEVVANKKIETKKTIRVLFHYCKNTLTILEKIGVEELLSFLEKFKYIEGLERVRLSSREQTIAIKNFHIWFDAFKTLKFIHQVRDFYCGTVDLKTLKIIYDD